MTAICEIVLISHGEANCDVADRVGGDLGDDGLSDRGKRQIHTVSSRLKREHQSGRPYVAIYTPSRRRVYESAIILAQTLDLPVSLEEGLTGPRYGMADGLSWTEATDRVGCSSDQK